MKTMDNIKAYICESFTVGIWNRKTIKVAQESVKIFITILNILFQCYLHFENDTLYANIINSIFFSSYTGNLIPFILREMHITKPWAFWDLGQTSNF